MKKAWKKIGVRSEVKKRDGGLVPSSVSILFCVLNWSGYTDDSYVLIYTILYALYMSLPF